MQRIILTARPCAELIGMIDADHEPIDHVSGSLQIGCIVHDHLTSPTSETVCGEVLGRM